MVPPTSTPPAQARLVAVLSAVVVGDVHVTAGPAAPNVLPWALRDSSAVAGIFRQMPAAPLGVVLDCTTLLPAAVPLPRLMLPMAVLVPPASFSMSTPLAALPSSQLPLICTLAPGMMRTPLALPAVQTMPLSTLCVVDVVSIQTPAAPLPDMMTLDAVAGLPTFTVPVALIDAVPDTKTPCCPLLLKTSAAPLPGVIVALDDPVIARPSRPLPVDCTPPRMLSAAAAVLELITEMPSLAKAEMVTFWIVADGDSTMRP